MILVRVFMNGQPVKPSDGNDGPWYSPEKALAILVGRLNGDAGITGISTSRNGEGKIVVDSPDGNERVEFQGNEDDMDLLDDVSLLYIQARPWLCSESVRALVK